MKKNLKFKWLPVAVAVALCAGIVFLQSCESDSMVVEDELCETSIAIVEILSALENPREVIFKVFPGGMEVVVAPDGGPELRSGGGTWITYLGLACTANDKGRITARIARMYGAQPFEVRFVQHPGGCFAVQHRASGGGGGGGGGSSGAVDCPPGDVPRCPPFGEEVFFPHPNDPHFFFVCTSGIAFCKECPGGLVWNQELHTCDYP